MKNKLIINVVSLLVVLILASITFLSYWQINQLANFEKKQNLTFSIIQNLDRLIKLTRDVRHDTSHFVSSGDKEYLESYFKSLAEVKNEMKILKGLANGIPWLNERMVPVELQVEEKLSEFRDQIMLSKNGNNRVALNRNNTRTKMSKIRESVAVAKEEAVTQMQHLTAKQENEFNKMQSLIVINCVIIFLLSTVLFIMLQRDIVSKANLNNQIGKVQEQERLAISREVHDDIGQSLVALKLDLNLIEHMLIPVSGEYATRLSEMHLCLDELLIKTNNITAKLRPPLLDNLGLAEAIEWQVNEFKRRSNIEFHLLLNESIEAYDQEVGLAIIRILQEALTNVIRHACATEVSISSCERADEFILEIADNGRGTNSKEIDSSKAYGIMGMRERALQCNGKLIISGNSGNGTVVSLTIPRDALKEK